MPILSDPKFYVHQDKVTAEKLMLGESSPVLIKSGAIKVYECVFQLLQAVYEMGVYMARDIMNETDSPLLNRSIAEIVEFEWRTVIISATVG